MLYRRFLLGAVAALALVGGAQAAAVDNQDLIGLSFEDLFAQEVTSVAKRPQRVDEAAAAVFVITQDDIRRSGATSLPELFRMVPGMEVATLPSGGAAVSARGFNSRVASNLLVLVDGREVYQSDFAGVLWDQQLAPLEDIQRIEIVRGPGATLWGANAVNGVINIVTKHSADALGGAASLRADGDAGGRAYARFGAAVGETGALRLYAEDQSDRDLATFAGRDMPDYHRAAQAGFRYDQAPTHADALTLQGDMQTGRFVDGPAAVGYSGDFSGGDILGRWTRTTGQDSGFALEAYYDAWRRREFSVVARAEQLNFDASGHFRVGDRQEVVVGLNYRRTDDHAAPKRVNPFATPFEIEPASAGLNWYGAYVQDDIKLIPKRLDLSLGVKLENDPYADVQSEPSARLMWRDPAGWLVWAAASRAMRTPSRFESGLDVDSPAAPIEPNPSLRPEALTAYEIGWRGEIGSRLSIDLTAYRNLYNHLIVWGLTPEPAPEFFAVRLDNRGKARGEGAEVAIEARPTPKWTLKLAGSQMRLTGEDLGLPVGYLVFDPGSSPKTQVSLRSWYDLSDAVDLDVWYRHVSRLSTGPTPAYDDLSIRLAWRPAPRWELSARGVNLLSDHRIEMVNIGIPSPAAIVQRRVQFAVSVRY